MHKYTQSAWKQHKEKKSPLLLKWEFIYFVYQGSPVPSVGAWFVCRTWVLRCDREVAVNPDLNMETGSNFDFKTNCINPENYTLRSPQCQGQRWTGKPLGRISAPCQSERWTERPLGLSCCPAYSYGWQQSDIKSQIRTPKINSLQYSPKIVNNDIFEGWFRATGWCSIAAIDVQFSVSWEMRSRDLEINSLSELVHLGLGWFTPWIWVSIKTDLMNIQNMFAAFKSLQSNSSLNVPSISSIWKSFGRPFSPLRITTVCQVGFTVSWYTWWFLDRGLEVVNSWL